MHGLIEKQEQKEMQNVVGLIGNHPMLSWIVWSNIHLSHEDQSKQVLRVSTVTFVIWWMKVSFLLLPIIICRLPSSLMNSLQSKDVELFQMHNMEGIDVQHDLNYDHINVKVMCLNDFYQVLFLQFINTSPSFVSTLGWKCWWCCL